MVASKALTAHHIEQSIKKDFAFPQQRRKVLLDLYSPSNFRGQTSIIVGGRLSHRVVCLGGGGVVKGASLCGARAAAGPDYRFFLSASDIGSCSVEVEESRASPRDWCGSRTVNLQPVIGA